MLTNSSAANDRLLTDRELGAIIGVDPKTLKAWRHRRVGPPFVQVGPRTARYRSSEVESWLASRAVAVSTAPVKP